MATLDRIEPAYKPWTPSASGLATEEEDYSGRHRKPTGGRGWAMFRFFYTAKHRRH